MPDSNALSPFAEMRQRLEQLCASATLAQELSESSVDLRGRIAAAIDSYLEILSNPAVFATLPKLRDQAVDKWMLFRVSMGKHAMLEGPGRGLADFILAQDGRIWRAGRDGSHIVSARRVEIETASLEVLDALMRDLGQVTAQVAERAAAQVGDEASAAARLESRLSRPTLAAGAADAARPRAQA